MFRTYNASVTLEDELEEMPIDAKESDKKSECVGWGGWRSHTFTHGCTGVNEAG